MSPSSIPERFAGVEVVHASHPYWPLPFQPAETSSISEHHVPLELSLSVLDSSFNPPTIAHLALARIPLSSSSEAKLLLFSIKNADKTPKPGDATPSQRLEMMVLLAQELEEAGKQSGDLSLQNIAVAVCHEPTFVGKSAMLTVFLRERLAAFSSSASIQLTFLLGFDTLERLFAPRYYGSASAMKDALHRFLSPSGDNCRIVCVRRSAGVSYKLTDTSVPDAATKFVDSGSIEFADIGEEERALSSSEVRDDASDAWMAKVPRAVAAYIKEKHLYRQSISLDLLQTQSHVQ